MNVNWLSSLPGPIRRGLYFGLQRTIGSNILSTWRELGEWTRYSPARLEAATETRLSQLLDVAVSQSAYYRELGLTRRPHESAGEFLRRFPILTRELVRERFATLVIDPLRKEIVSPDSVSARRYDWLVVKTGGTTGNPTTVVHDARARDWGRATRLFSAQQSGFPLGTRYFRLWGSEQDLLRQQARLHLRVQNQLLGEIPLNAFRAREADLTRHLQTMGKHSQVRHLMAYVDAAVSLALFVQDKGLPRLPLQTIMACAGTVTPEWRQILEETFRAEVFDKYGSRECCDIACECRQHTGLHVYAPNIFLEVVDEAGQPGSPGQMGRILVTLLNNGSFPMIRYQIGDLGAWAEPGPCPCGLPFPRLQSLQGRQDDLLTTEDGTLLSSVFVRHFVGVSLNRQLIREWQLEQTGRAEFIFRYIPLRRDGLEDNLAEIKQGFHLALGRKVQIELQEVSEIPLSATGKVRWIVNRFRLNVPSKT